MRDLRIDLDTIVYRAGFAADSNAEELSRSFSNCNLLIHSIIKKFQPCKVTMYLTSTDPNVNFRFNVDSEYKAHRSKKCPNCEKGTYELIDIGIKLENEHKYRFFSCSKCDAEVKDTKPAHYTEIREYLIDKYNATVAPWGEADDYLGIGATENTIIASNDKDLLMVPCWHYRITANKTLKSDDPGRLFLSKCRKKILGTGIKWFCAQLLLGDNVDNIKGIKGYGPVKVYTFLKDINNIKTMFQAVKNVYKLNKREVDFDKNCKLLWMAREPKQIFSEELIDEYQKSAALSAEG